MIALLARYWYLVAIAGLVALLGVQELRVNNAQTNLAEYKQEVQANALASEQAARAEEQRKQDAYDQQAAHARTEIKELEASVSMLADVGDGLRNELTAFKQRARSQPKTPNGSTSKPSADPLDVLADLYARADTEAAGLASYADRLRVAGAACERASDQIAN